MTNEISYRDTVVIEEKAHEIYKQFTEGNNTQSVPFRTMKDVFMWATCLGAQQGKRRPLTGKRVTVFRWAQFDIQVDVPLLKAIAIVDCGNVNILLNRNDILSLIEEYANGGIYDLHNILMGERRQPLWNLVEILS